MALVDKLEAQLASARASANALLEALVAELTATGSTPGESTMADQSLRPIPARWLEKRVNPRDRDFEKLRSLFAAQWQDGDEVWEYDEPAPPGINAGELGVALVRAGRPIHAVMLGVH